MTKIIAAVDNSATAGPVLATARSLAGLFDATVEAVHVREDGERMVRAAAAAAAEVPLRTVTGRTIDVLIDAAAADDVVALVVGARRTPAGARPVGTTAFELMRSLPKPVAVVPPDTVRAGKLHRVVVPLEGTASTSLAPKSLIHLARAAELDVVIVHVRGEESLPAFTDQPQHEGVAWAQEFLARYCPWGVGDVRLEGRIGRREEQIVRAAEENDADLIALGWSQELAGGRAPVVRAVLEHARVPVLLIPVRLVAAGAAENESEEPWRNLHSSRA
jgi:nucleotide-binding universal stress UspA family protein